MSLRRFNHLLPLPVPLPLPVLLLLLTSLLAAIPVIQANSSSSSTGTSPPSPLPGVRIIRSPESRVAPPGDEVIFVCETSLPPERFEWSYAGSRGQTHAQNPMPRFKYLKSSNNLSITHDNDISRLRVFVRAETLGEYRCVAWFGPLAVTSTTARLELASLTKVEGSAVGGGVSTRWRVSPGNTLHWNCGQVNSNPAASWSYYHNGRELPVASSFNGTLLVPVVSPASSGRYSCEVTNTASGLRLSLPNNLELQVPSSSLPPTAPHLLSEQSLPTEYIAKAGETVLLPCPGVGSPPPTAIWSSPDVPGAIHNRRTQQLPSGLSIIGVQVHDAGSYSCYLDNGIRPALQHFIQLRVQQPPRIVLAPSANLTNEGARLELQCVAEGVPTPKIYWLLNGESSVYDVEAELQPNGYLLLHSLQKRHAGYVQCFARNLLGEHSAGTLLQVNPTQIQTGESTAGISPRPNHRKQKQQRQMVPPSAPNVTRLSDESVMLRWQVLPNLGLDIQFFKVQYRLLSEGGKRRSWQTTNENIPYGKQDKHTVKNFTSSVTGLRPDRTYRFRIMAVYSNNDNKESNTSGKFYLQRGAALAPLAVPELVEIEEYSQSAVVLHWRLGSSADEHLISGYYAYYRPSASAGEYLKATIDGATTRSFQISSLEAGTIYEFKLQSFSAVAASEFSALKQGRPRLSTTPQPVEQAVDTTITPGHNETFRLNPLLTGTIGGGALLLLVVISACLCLCRRRTSSRSSNTSQQKPHLAELREDFLPLNACSPNKPRTRHIHITLNPLAQQAQQLEEKDAQQDQDLGYFQRQPVESMGFNGVSRMSSSSLRRSQRTLERAASGGNNNNLNLNQPAEGSLPESPRSNNKSGRVILKRARLSSRSENLSSGSLNSVGV